jgi:hypothetical protein
VGAPTLSRQSKATRTALFLKPGMAFETWRDVGAQVGSLNDASTWWIGDWLAYGVKTYPDRYRTAIEATGFGYQTLRNYAWVAGRFPPPRRRPGLSFGHHADVAALDEVDQETWLLRATLNAWTRAELRRQLRAARPAPHAKLAQSTSSSVALALRVEELRHARWRAAASAGGQPLAEWIARTLDEAAEATLAANGAPPRLELVG